MLLSNSDASTLRIEACALTELALGEDRVTTAFRLASISIALLADLDRGGAQASVLAERLRSLAERIEDKVP